MHKKVKNMQKLVLGMIVIICLDIGFAAYMAIDNQADTSSKTVDRVANDFNPASNSSNNRTKTTPPAGPTLMKRGPAEVEIVKRASIGSDDSKVKTFVRRKGNAEVSLLASSKDRGLPARTYSVIMSDPYALQKPYEVKPRTEYPAKMPVYGRSHGSAPTAKDMRKSDKKSFVASTLPVLKKPYEWIKAIGSKMF